MLNVGQIEGFLSSVVICEPWRVSAESLWVVAPLLREREKDRTYKTLSEAKVAISEIGEVRRLKARSDDEIPVFLKSGEILIGFTQERAVAVSQVLDVAEEREIEVFCVHQSKGLSSGAQFSLGGLTPVSIANVCYKSSFSHNNLLPDQGDMWEGIKNFTSRSISGGISYTEAGVASSSTLIFPMDDLCQTVRAVSMKFEEIISKVPLLQHQVGMALFDIEGLKALEVYDHDKSWSAVREKVLQRYGEDFSKTSPTAKDVFKYQPEFVESSIRELDFEYFVLTPSKSGHEWETVLLQHEKYYGEATVHMGNLIHLMILRK